MSFTWDEMLSGLDSGLDVVKTISAVVPGGQAIAIGATALDMVVEKINKETPEQTSSPIDIGISVFEAAAKSSTKDVGIDNDAIIKLLETITLSTHNTADDKLLCIVKSYLNCDKK